MLEVAIFITNIQSIIDSVCDRLNETHVVHISDDLLQQVRQDIQSCSKRQNTGIKRVHIDVSRRREETRIERKELRDGERWGQDCETGDRRQYRSGPGQSGIVTFDLY